MKSIILTLTFAVIIFACKSDKKEKEASGKQAVKKEIVLTNIMTPDFSLWEKTRANLTKTSIKYQKMDVFTITRSTTLESSYVRVKNIDVDYDIDYRTSIIVKKGKETNLFGLRISGTYPDRVDAVFDLEKGIVKGVKSSRDFENESATINSLGDGWYKCTVKATIVADKVSVLFGPTTDERKIVSWEGTTKTNCDLNIIPTSLTFEKITEK